MEEEARGWWVRRRVWGVRVYKGGGGRVGAGGRRGKLE